MLVLLIARYVSNLINEHYFFIFYRRVDRPWTRTVPNLSSNVTAVSVLVSTAASSVSLTVEKSPGRVGTVYAVPPVG